MARLCISHWKTKDEGRRTKDKGQKRRLGRDVPVTELVEVWNVSTRNPTQNITASKKCHSASLKANQNKAS